MDAVFTFAYAMRNTLENDSITDQLSVSLNCLEGSWTHGPQLLKNLREVCGTSTDEIFNQLIYLFIKSIYVY